MATYGFSGLNANSSGKSIDTSAKRLIFSGRIKDIILNDQHPRFPEFDYGGIGVIFWDDIAIPSNPQFSDIATGYAYPLFPNQKHYPLLNEVVALIKLPSFTSDESTTSIETYYFSPTSVWGEVHSNAIPLPQPPPSNQARSYQQTEAGATNVISDEYDPLKLGNTFIEKDDIRGLQPYEGDHILEGRWGNSIRFGSTVKEGIPQNGWSEGENNFEGDPLTIIRNGQSFPQGDFSPILEKIQTDPSSIYLTSTQKLNFLPSSDLKNSFITEDQEVTPVVTNQYEGNSQIILNSGRLVLNSNSDSVLISSPEVIHLSANRQIHLDSIDKTVISTSKLFLGDRNATERVVKGDTLVLELQKLVIALEGLAKACTTATAGPIPIASLISIGPVVEAAIKDFKKSLAGKNPKILSKDVKTK
jgi:hypothetical protein